MLVVKPVQPTASGKAQFKVHLEPFDRSYGDLGQLKVIVVAGNPVKYKLAPTETQVTLPKTTGQGKVNAR